MLIESAFSRIYLDIFLLTPPRIGVVYGINTFTCMTAQADLCAKVQALKTAGTFNSRADQVRHPLFGQSDFFDPQDLPQLKYETLRALDLDGYSIARAAREFGLSRPTIYQAHVQFTQQGLEGLLPHKRGPKKPHKLTPQVQRYLEEVAGSQAPLPAAELARRLRRRFRVKLHPRTIEKALKAKGKKGAPPPTP